MAAIPSTRARPLAAVIAIVVIIGTVWISYAAYRGAFLATIPVTVQTERVGLGVLPGTKVMLHGVKVGRVTEVDTADSGEAELSLEIDKDAAKNIPRNTTAVIDTTTLFGPKVVALEIPRSPSEERLQAHDVVQARVGAPEIDQLFKQIDRLLNVVDPAQLSTALTGLAQSLDGNGEKIGALVTDMSKYLTVVNTKLPALDRTVLAGTTVVETLAQATPDLVGVLKNSGLTSETLVAVKPNLATFLASISTSTDQVGSLALAAGPPLVQATNRTRPILSLLAEFAPEFPCLSEGMDYARMLVEAVSKGKYPALAAAAFILPGQTGYQYPQHLPKIVTGIGPHCYGLPRTNRDGYIAPHLLFNDGTADTFTRKTGPADPGGGLSDALFGQSLTDLLSSLGGGQGR